MESTIEKENEKLYLLIYADIIVTKGITKITLIDSSRSKVFELPISYFELMEDLKNYSLADIKNIYDDENTELFFDFIITNDLGFITTDKDSFPPIDQQYLSPEEINNSIIEINKSEQLSNLEYWLKDLDNLGCKFYELRFYSSLDFTIFNSILSKFEFDSLQSINLYIQFSTDFQIIDCVNLLGSFPYIKNIYIFQYSQNRIINSKENSILNNEQKIIFLKDTLSKKNCGKINYEMFLPREINQITENLCHNSCLHKKLSIDVDGNIKNCPSMPKSYGNVNEISIDTVLLNDNFKEFWSITKDNIKVCKDCEYRYICMDCRAYTEQNHFSQNNLDISKPLKCGYDPYTGIWEEWSKNPLKRKIISYYGL